MGTKKLVYITVLFLITLTLVSCKGNFIKNGTYVCVANDEYYITVRDEKVSFDRPFFGEDANDFYHLYIYMTRLSELQEANPGIILTDEEKEALKKDLPDFNPEEYIGKTYKLEFMNEQSYVKGDVYDLMTWEDDQTVEVLSGEYDPETGILTLGGTSYILKK